jgi:hypothetical protein
VTSYKGPALLSQPYAQVKYQFSPTVEGVAGLHGQHYTLNNDYAIEPRGSLRWFVAPKHALSFGAGQHSQALPAIFHFATQPGDYGAYNARLGFLRSRHIVGGYEWTPKATFRLKSEAFYQRLYNVPVNTYRSSRSVLNRGGDTYISSYDTLVNKGTGENYGVEMTLERFFSKNYFFLVTGTLYRSRYQGSDRVWHSTDFDGRFTTNFLVGREIPLTQRSLLILGAKIAWAGGRRYSGIDTTASAAKKDVVVKDNERNIYKYPNYFRADLRVGYKLNAKKVTHEVYIDFNNVTNHTNFLSPAYVIDPSGRPTVQNSAQLGFLPLLYYRVDF